MTETAGRAVPGRTPDRTPGRAPGLVGDLLIGVAGFGIAGALGAVVWVLVARPPVYVRTAQGAQMDQLQLTGLFPVVGWFAVIALVLSVLVGAGLMLWRVREPLWTVLTALVGSAAGAWVMRFLGRDLGPGDPADKLRHAAVGTTAQVQLVLGDHHYRIGALDLAVPVATLVWPAGAMLGIVIVLMLVSSRPPVAAPEPVTSGRAGPPERP